MKPVTPGLHQLLAVCHNAEIVRCNASVRAASLRSANDPPQ